MSDDSPQPPADFAEDASLTPMPPAKVRMVPVALVGTVLWLVASLVVLLADLGSLALHICLAGAVLGIVALPWARYFDSKLTGSTPQP